MRRRYPVINNNSSFIFNECTEMNYNTAHVDGLCIPIFLNNMGRYSSVIGKLYNYGF